MHWQGRCGYIVHDLISDEMIIIHQGGRGSEQFRFTAETPQGRVLNSVMREQDERVLAERRMANERVKYERNIAVKAAGFIRALIHLAGGIL